MAPIQAVEINSFIIMIVMGMATVYGVGLTAQKVYDINYLEDFVLQSHIGFGIKGDVVTVAMMYVPIMLLSIFLRNKGIGKSVLSLRTPYNVVMTLFSAYSFITMAMWRFSPTFAGETHGDCNTAWNQTFVVGGVTIGSFELTTYLFYCSKFVE